MFNEEKRGQRKYYRVGIQSWDHPEKKRMNFLIEYIIHKKYMTQGTLFGFISGKIRATEGSIIIWRVMTNF